jgi:thiamine kinase-like enzyme
MHEEISIPELTAVVAHVAALLGPREGAVTALDGGITNRNFRVRFGGTDYVVRLPGKNTALLGIDREAECIANTHAGKLGIAPPVAAFLENPPCLVTRFIAGRELAPEELREPGNLAEVARGLRTFHDSGVELPTEFDSFRVVEDYASAAASRGAEARRGLDEALARARAIRDAVAGHEEHVPVPCHDDLLSANFLHDGERVMIVDWEYAGMGDPFFDLGNFSSNHELSEAEDRVLLAAYYGEVLAPRLARLTLMRVVSDFREAMWGVLQQGISTLDVDFVGYASSRFERLLANATDPRFETAIETLRTRYATGDG